MRGLAAYPPGFPLIIIPNHPQPLPIHQRSPARAAQIDQERLIPLLNPVPPHRNTHRLDPLAGGKGQQRRYRLQSLRRAKKLQVPSRGSPWFPQPNGTESRVGLEHIPTHVS